MGSFFNVFLWNTAVQNRLTGVKRWSFPMNKTSLKNDIIILGLTVLDIKSNMYVELKRQFL